MQTQVSVIKFAKTCAALKKIEEASARAGKSPEKNVDQLYQRMARLFENLKHAHLD